MPTVVLMNLVRDPCEPAPIADATAWWNRHREHSFGERKIDRAIRTGFRMDRLGWAFASGYTEALAQLVGSTAGGRAAFCATEEGGAHPRSIKTKLERNGDGWRLNGTKGHVTLGTFADSLLVVASRGEGEDGRNQLAVVKIPADREGVVLQELDPLPFVPEIPHARLELKNVEVAEKEWLRGDGYTDYLKPFRTVEDIFVHAAVLGWLVQVARRCELERSVIQELLLLASNTRDLSEAPKLAACTHLALGALIDRTRNVIESFGWDKVDAETRERFERDRPLLEVASSARAQRLESAWKDLG